MIDIHAHIIPYVDDGSKSLEDSIELIKEEIKQGVKRIICTPHYDLKRRYTPSNDEILKNYNLLKDEVKKQNLEIELYLGQEICYYPSLPIVEMLNNNKLFTMKDSRYILLEFDFFEKPYSIREVIYNFRIYNYHPIIAHVERYDWMNEFHIKELIAEGALIQVNASSLIEKTNKKEHKKAKKYIKKGYVNYIASDIHVFRNNCLKKAIIKYGKYINQIEI